MRLHQFVGVLEVLAESETGATIGKIQKMNLFMTRGQVERVLKELIMDEFVTVEKVPYRKHINANIYHITDKAVEYCETIVRKFDKRMKQQTLPIDDYMQNMATSLFGQGVSFK